jgi:hypothetical protein
VRTAQPRNLRHPFVSRKWRTIARSDWKQKPVLSPRPSRTKSSLAAKMDDQPDPALQFFPDGGVDLYKTLDVKQEATDAEIKKAYRK